MSKKRLRLQPIEYRFYLAHPEYRGRHAYDAIAVPVSEIDPWNNGRCFVRYKAVNGSPVRPALVDALLSKEMLLDHFLAHTKEDVAAGFPELVRLLGA